MVCQLIDLLPEDERRGRRQQAFNEHLTQALDFLLGTKKVDLDVQQRYAEKAAPELKGIILGSIKSMP